MLYCAMLCCARLYVVYAHYKSQTTKARHWRIWMLLVLFLLLLLLLVNILLWANELNRERSILCALCVFGCVFFFTLFMCVVYFLSLISSHTISSCFMFYYMRPCMRAPCFVHCASCAFCSHIYFTKHCLWSFRRIQTNWNENAENVLWELWNVYPVFNRFLSV